MNIVVFSLPVHFSHLKTRNFTSGCVRNRGLGSGTHQAARSKQECSFMASFSNRTDRSKQEIRQSNLIPIL